MGERRIDYYQVASARNGQSGKARRSSTATAVYQLDLQPTSDNLLPTGVCERIFEASNI